MPTLRLIALAASQALLATAAIAQTTALDAVVVTGTRAKDRTLADTARARLRKLGYDNVEVLLGDGLNGEPMRAPYDRIVQPQHNPLHVPRHSGTFASGKALRSKKPAGLVVQPHH